MLRWLMQLLVVVLLPVAAMGEEPADPCAGWPSGWKSAYRKFENFIASQMTYWPESGLEILPDGTISSNMTDDGGNHVALFHEGADLGEVMATGNLFAIGQNNLLYPGKYSACIKSFKFTKYHYPIFWFETYRPEKPGKSGSQAEEELRVRMIDAPQPADDYWPNERMLRFRDFHVFPNANPFDIQRKNRRVSPTVVLRVTNTGEIQRQPLAADAEKVLRWHIYYNGRLIDKGPASDDLSHRVSEMGAYVAMVCVEGPNGFMPVSNLLQFPIFREKSGCLSVLPPATTPDRFPDFLHDILSPEQIREIAAAVAEPENPGYYHKQAIYGLNPGYQLEDPDKQALFSLWIRWSRDIDRAKQSPPSELSRIYIEPTTKPQE